MAETFESDSPRRGLDGLVAEERTYWPTLPGVALGTRPPDERALQTPTDHALGWFEKR